MNIKSFLGCLGIGMAVSLSVGLGTAAGVKNTDVKGANAANNGRFSILIDDDSWWKNDYAQIWATYSSAGEIRITPDPDLGTVDNDGFTWQDMGTDDWYAVLTMEVDTTTFTYGNFYFQRKNPSDGSDWGNSGWVLAPSQVKNGTCNTVRIASDNSFNQDWGNYWKMTAYSGVTSYANLSAATKNCYLKSSEYGFKPDDPSAPTGYEFVGWYEDTSFTKAWTASSKMTKDTTIYAKYEAVSVALNDGTELGWNSTNLQYEAIKYFDASSTFHIVKTVGSTSTNYATLDSYMSSSVATSDGTNVTVKNAGTYAIYFKNDNTIWIQTADADQEAYMYAGYFLTNVGCDNSGVNLPSGWSTVAARYSSLSGDAKNLFYNAVADPESENTIIKVVTIYDHAVAGHSTLAKFMVNSSGTARGSSSARITSQEISLNSNPGILIVVISSISIISIGGLFFLTRKRKVR